MYLDEQGTPTKDSLEGYRASGVPGSVAGLFALHAKLGKKPWKELLEPAITLARDGFQIDKRLAKSALAQPSRHGGHRLIVDARVLFVRPHPVDVPLFKLHATLPP